MSASINPKPSYHVCPDFSIAPPPYGHLELGSLLTSLDFEGVTDPLNHGAVVQVPEDVLYPRSGPDVKFGFQSKMSQLRSVEAGIWAKILGLNGVGLKLGWLSQRTASDILTIKELKTRYFIPSEPYMAKALAEPSVASFITAAKKRIPLYMVTGIKWAVGTSLSCSRGSKLQGMAEAGAVEPNSGMAIGGKVDITRDNSSSASFSGSHDFIIGFRVRKIWWKGGVMHHSAHNVGSALDGEGQKRPGLTLGMEFVDDFGADGGQERTENVLVDEQGLGGMEPAVWNLP